MDNRPVLHYSEIHMHGVSELLSHAANEVGQPAALEMIIAVGIEANNYDEAKAVISRYVRLDNWDNN